jgi:dynactin complex subunit
LPKGEETPFTLFLSFINTIFFNTDRHEGKVAFVGEVHYAKGIYVGIIMKDSEHGKNNGTVRGTEYFQCKGKEKGLMLPLSEVTLIK